MLPSIVTVFGVELLLVLWVEGQNGAETSLEQLAPNVDPTLLLEHERLLNGARLAIQRISQARTVNLGKRQTDKSKSSNDDDDEDDGQYHHEDEHNHHDHNHGKWDIRKSVPGEPGVDYPVYEAVPSTQFSCRGLPIGYYADKEARCQAFHVCSTFPPLTVKNSFLCPNGSIFSQELLVCEWWNKVNCSDTPTLINTGEEIFNTNLNEGKDKNIQSELDATVTNLNDNNTNSILSLTDDSNTLIKEDKNTFIQSNNNESSFNIKNESNNTITSSDEANTINKLEENMKVIESTLASGDKNLQDNSNKDIGSEIGDGNYNTQDLANQFINSSTDDSFNYNKEVNQSIIISEGVDKFNKTMEITTPGYVYSKPTIGLTYPSTVKQYADKVETNINFNNHVPLIVNTVKPDSFSSTVMYDQQDNFISHVPNVHEQFTPDSLLEIPIVVPNLVASTTPGIQGYEYNTYSTSQPDSSQPTTGYFYNSPEIKFSYPPAIDRRDMSISTPVYTGSPFTTAQFSSVKTSTPPSVVFIKQTPSPSTVTNRGNEFSKSNYLEVKFTQTTPMPFTLSGQPQSGAMFSQNNNNNNNIVEVKFSKTPTPQFLPQAGEPFSVKTTTEQPISSVSAQGLLENEYDKQTIIKNINYQFSTKNTTANESRNTFVNNTTTRVVTIADEDDDESPQSVANFLNNLHTLSQDELSKEPSLAQYSKSLELPSSTSQPQPFSKSTTLYTTARPVTTTEKDSIIPEEEKPSTESPLRLLLALSNKDVQNKLNNDNTIPGQQNSGFNFLTNVNNINENRIQTVENESSDVTNFPLSVEITQRPITVHSSHLNAPHQQTLFVPNQQRFTEQNRPFLPPQTEYRQHGYVSNSNSQPSYPPNTQSQNLVGNTALYGIDFIANTKLNFVNDINNYNTRLLPSNVHNINRLPNFAHSRLQNPFEAIVIPSVSFDFDSDAERREFNLAVSSGLLN